LEPDTNTNRQAIDHLFIHADWDDLAVLRLERYPRRLDESEQRRTLQSLLDIYATIRRCRTFRVGMRHLWQRILYERL
jgi:hypothetical protein